MEFSLKYDTVKSGRSTVYFEGPQFIVFKNAVFLSLKIDSDLTNSADPDEIAHSVT